MNAAIEKSMVPTRRAFLTGAAATGALNLAPTALIAGDLVMDTKTEARPVGKEAPRPQNANLFLVEDLDNDSKTGSLAQSDLTALRAVADWTKTFVIRPHKDLGRTGPVCPFTPVAIDHKALWLAPERSAGKSKSDIIELIKGYQRLLLSNSPNDGEVAADKAIVVVFSDLPAARAKDFIGGALEPIAIPSYVNDGLVMGPFYEGNDGTAIYNPNFRPFTSPVPFMLMRRAVVSDWKFFLNNDAWFDLWANRYGESGTKALADEIRRLPWNAKRG